MKNLKLLIIALGASLFLMTCEKQIDYYTAFESSIISEQTNEVALDVRIWSDVPLDAQGLLYSLDTVISFSENYTWEDEKISGRVVDVELLENRIYNLKDLRPGTRYYYKLYSVYRGKITYSDLMSFDTDCKGLGCGPAGGQIIYLDGLGGGIEVAPEITLKGWWSDVCDGIYVGTSTDFGSGAANTNLIVASCGTNNLAYQCANYSHNGYSDYYMPSIEELQLIYEEVFLGSENPFQWGSSDYVSSSESGASYCWKISFNSGGQVQQQKSYSYFSTIPIRSF